MSFMRRREIGSRLGNPRRRSFADRRNNVDFRVAKILRFGGRRTQVGVDIYNLMNVDVVTAYNQTFVPGGPLR